MAKKHITPEIEDAAEAAEQTPPQPPAPVWRYVGPDYTEGIAIGGRRDLVRPRDMSRAEAERLIEQHPKCAAWWLLEN